VDLLLCATKGLNTADTPVPPRQSFASFLSPLRQFPLEHDDFLQGVRVMLPLKLQLAFEISVTRRQPRNILLPKFQFH
jgi:hypothetical protein